MDEADWASRWVRRKTMKPSSDRTEFLLVALSVLATAVQVGFVVASRLD